MMSSLGRTCHGAKLVRGRGTPYNDLYWEAPPEKGSFFRIQVYERVGISQVEVLYIKG